MQQRVQQSKMLCTLLRSAYLKQPADWPGMDIPGHDTYPFRTPYAPLLRSSTLPVYDSIFRCLIAPFSGESSLSMWGVQHKEMSLQ